MQCNLKYIESGWEGNEGQWSLLLPIIEPNFSKKENKLKLLKSKTIAGKSPVSAQSLHSKKIMKISLLSSLLIICYWSWIKMHSQPPIKILDFQNKRYLTPEKYLEDQGRCKIGFWTTFVFCTKLIFQLPFEL